MTCDADDQYWLDRIAKVKALIDAYDAALLAVGTNQEQQYSLDTGQTRIMVTKANLATIRDTRRELLDELDELQARCRGRAFIAAPGF